MFTVNEFKKHCHRLISSKKAETKKMIKSLTPTLDITKVCNVIDEW